MPEDDDVSETVALAGTRTPGITLRRFDAKRDAEAVSRIVGDIWGGGGPALMEQRFGPVGGKPWMYWMSRSVLSDLTAADAESYVAEVSGDVIGFCSLTLDRERDRGTVGYNGVSHAHQGQGLGSAMLAFVLARMRTLGVDHAVVIVQDNEAHAPARAMYERQGFEELGGFRFMVQKL